MTGEHKTAVHEWIIEVRLTHDTFCGKFKSYQQEQNHIYEQKKRNREEKQQKSHEVKARIEQNIESNKEKLAKAENALRSIERARDNLKDKIDESHSDNWKSKAEG